MKKMKTHCKTISEDNEEDDIDIGNSHLKIIFLNIGSSTEIDF